MTKIISVDEIGLCRTGPDNDIDLTAVFGGIKSRQQKGLKVNPLYDSQSPNSTLNVSQDINGNINNVHVVTYNSIPDPNTGNGVPVTNTENVNGVTIAQPNGSDKDGVSKDSNGNERSGSGSTKINGLNEVIGKNGSIKRREVVSGVNGGVSKRAPMSVDLGQSELNGNIDKGIKTEDGLVEHGRRYSKPQSDYQLLGYNNDGYTIDETELELNQVDGGAESTDHASVTEHSVGKTAKDLDVNSNIGVHANSVSIGGGNVTVVSIEQNGAKTSSGPVNDGNTEDEGKENDQEIPGVGQVRKNTNENMSQNPVIESQDLKKSSVCVSNTELSRVTERRTQTLTRSSSSYSSASEQSVKTEIVTEVHVHSVETNQNHKDIKDINALHHNPDNGPETGQESDVGITGHINCGSSTEAKIDNKDVYSDNVAALENVSVSVTDDNQGALNPNHGDNENVTEITQSDSAKTVSFATVETEEETVVSNGCKTNTSSTRTLKSILSTSSGKNPSPPPSPKSEPIARIESMSEIQECRSVTFAQDTVFNENKSKRHKLDRMEKLNLRNIYHGKISSDAAVAKMNPIFKDDGEGERSMSEDERIAYQISLKKMMKSNKGKGKQMSTSEYKDHYLILKANGIRASNMDIDGLQDDIEQPAYDRLIQRTIAKERRKLIVKWTLVILTVAIVTAVATVLGVHFK